MEMGSQQDVNTGMTEMLALFDDNFKTAIIKKILQWATRNMLKANLKKKKKSGQRKKEIKRRQIKKFRPKNTIIKIKTQ